MKNEVRLLKIVMDFLDGLSEEQLTALAEKEARLKYESRSSGSQQPSAPTAEALSVCGALKGCSSREEAHALFAEKKFKKKDLTAIAAELGIRVASKDRVDQIRDKIIEGVVGSKLKHGALLSVSLGE